MMAPCHGSLPHGSLVWKLFCLFLPRQVVSARRSWRDVVLEAGGISLSSSRTDGAGELEWWDAMPSAGDGKRGRAAHPCQAGSQRDGAGWGPGAREDSMEEQKWSDPSCRVWCPSCTERVSAVVLARQTAQVAPSPGCSCKNPWWRIESGDPLGWYSTK